MDWLFDTSAFVTRGHCGQWSGWLVALWVAVSAGLFVLYVAVAALNVSLWRATRHTSYPGGWNLWVAAFFLGCGGGHLMNALAFTWPAYRAFVLWDVYTLAVSTVGLVGVWRIVAWKVERVRRLELERDAYRADLTELVAGIAAAEARLTASERTADVLGDLRALRERLDVLKADTLTADPEAP